MPLSAPPLVESYLQYCDIAAECKENKVLNLSTIEWIYPGCLLPILGTLKQNGMKYIPPKNPSVEKYLNIMEKNHRSPPQTAVPIVPLPKGDRDNKEANRQAQKITDDGKITGGKQATAYFIDELVNNIYDHSKFNNAFIMAQRYNKMKFMEIGFYDDGVSIPGSYREYGMKFTDIEAVKAALDGVSSKMGQERGYGLCTSVKLLREGLDAEIFVVSKGAGFHFSPRNIEAFDLKNRGILDGTLVCARIPFTTKDVDIYDYI